MSIDYTKWRELCSDAIVEKDVNKLFKLFVELDRGSEREQRRRSLFERAELLIRPGRGTTLNDTPGAKESDSAKRFADNLEVAGNLAEDVG